MSPNVRFSAVFGTVLAALCFALWRTTRKAKNSARGSEPPEINRGGLDRKPETSAAIAENVSQPVEPPSSISPASRSEETERQTAFEVDQASPSYSPSDKIGILVAERQMAAAENAWPHNSSVIAFTFRVDTPWIYISARADTSAFSDLWYLSKIWVEKCPCRS